jgi:nitrogen fixation protein NifQ
MDATEVYGWLANGGQRSVCEAFDAHVLASILALGVAEANTTRTPVSESVGLSGAVLAGLVEENFPHAAAVFRRVSSETLAPRPDEEENLRDMLWSNATEGSVLEARLAEMVARRCMRPNHLWQDLGLRNRRELSWLMERHFEPLARRNAKDMKWKKFFYRAICSDASFRLCASPICSECDDFDLCFGDESGESLLARNRREAELRA